MQSITHDHVDPVSGKTCRITVNYEETDDNTPCLIELDTMKLRLRPSQIRGINVVVLEPHEMEKD